MRSIWKGAYLKRGSKTIHNSSVLLNVNFKNKLLVTDGRSFKSLIVSRYMLGLKVGEFVFTRKMGVQHKKKKIVRGKKK